eukprot:TRINITY_DN9564_c0_g1_i1.p1 TRINITY_DN9564_c0_g1~~TRINITY_DN9564_c0_g1_i1.p1  ORF type:complete len:161 (-),score=34.18 TRINITY_DN9564_c0_g1_i1:227-709(-)
MGDHTESVQIEWDSSKTTYEDLLKIFWDNHSPTHRSSTQYKSAIWYHDRDQKDAAEKSFKQRSKEIGKTLYTTIEPAGTWTDAEGYHQKYQFQGSSLAKTLNLDEGELIESSIAARINGYVGGNGTKENLLEEIATFNLPQADQEKLLRLVGKSGGSCRF